MILPDMYCHEDFETLQESIIVSHNLRRTKKHWNEAVAQILWRQWYKSQSLEDRDRFLLYLCPFVTKLCGPFIRFIESDSYGLQYEDLWMSAYLKCIDMIAKYDPLRLGKNGPAKLFSYYTHVLTWHLKHITSAEYKLQSTREQYGEVSLGTNATQQLVDLRIFAEEFSQRRNLKQSHKQIYQYISQMPIDAPHVHALSQTIANAIGTTPRDVDQALRLLRKAYPSPAISNLYIYTPPAVSE